MTAGASWADGSKRHRVVVAGGGVAGVEALLGLHELAGETVELTLVSSAPDFVNRPLLVEEPFTVQPAERRELAPLAASLGAEFVQRSLASVDADRREAVLDDGARIPYDSLVVCVGASTTPAFSAALTFPSPLGPFRIDDVLAQEEDGMRIAFIIPAGVGWALPMYELALMTKRRGRERHEDRVGCTIVTPESAPLSIFGTAVSDAVAKLLSARGVEIELGAYVRESAPGVLVVLPADRELEAEAVISLPLLEGPRIPGLPCDEEGFLPIDEHARVDGLDGVYAAGDGAAFPIKQGGIGAQQADAAAEHIARRAGADVTPAPFRPVLRGELMTGADPLHMRHEVAGGEGEGMASEGYLWWPPQKIVSRYVSGWLARTGSGEEPEAPSPSVDVEVALPREWHVDPAAFDPYGPLSDR